MPNRFRTAAALAAVIGLSTAFAGPVAAQGGVQVGTLTCNASGSWGFVFGSTREIACTFVAPGRVERYRGQIAKFGIDIGYTEGAVMVWTVVAPTAQLRPGDLAGSYGGATASATIGVGIGANALIGGSNNTISLQPLSIETNRGLNIAAGVASLTLAPAG